MPAPRQGRAYRAQQRRENNALTVKPSGLTVERHGSGWGVYHEGSGLPVVDGGLRQRRFAEEARTELLATGVDFTQDKSALHSGTEAATIYRPVMCKWQTRRQQDFIDPETFEHYSVSTRYGQIIPSATLAQLAREIVAGTRERFDTNR